MIERTDGVATLEGKVATSKARVATSLDSTGYEEDMHYEGVESRSKVATSNKKE